MLPHLDASSPETFNTTLWQWYWPRRRSFSWRDQIDPYHVFVSEIMLQQTQTSRVVDKFRNFVAEIPTFQALADCSRQQLLSCWSGLGYNRRALYLQESAKKLLSEYGGVIPSDPEKLRLFPGIGKATAASIIVFNYNMPLSFIETNVRTVFIYHFFQGSDVLVPDSQIVPLVSHYLDSTNPREWYYAIMDYGVVLKRLVGNVCVRSAAYKKQAPFKGSDRELRGYLVRYLLSHGALYYDQLLDLPVFTPRERRHAIVEQLIKEKIITMVDSKLLLVG